VERIGRFAGTEPLLAAVGLHGAAPSRFPQLPTEASAEAEFLTRKTAGGLNCRNEDTTFLRRVTSLLRAIWNECLD
jgi:hypothetical protein